MTGSNLPLGLQDFAEIEDEGKVCFEIQNQETGHSERERQGFSAPQIKKPGFKKKHQLFEELQAHFGEPSFIFPNIPNDFFPQGNSL